MLCASIGTTDCLEIVLAFGPNLNATDKFGRSALHFACQRGDKDILQMLLEIREVYKDLQTRAGVTPLMMAASSGDLDIVYECLNAGMNPFLKDGLNQTATDYV